MAEGGIPSSDALSGMISTLMSNPDLLQNIKNALGGLSVPDDKAEKEAYSVSDSGEEKDNDSSNPMLSTELMSKLPVIMNALSGNGKSKGEKEREALLCALKPYLSAEKAGKIDKLISLMRIGDILSVF